MKIAVFDSGLGGRIILDAIRARLPAYDYVYYGDTAHLPYGDKTEAEIRTLTRAAVLRLFREHDVALIIIACNTASAESLRALQDELITGAYKDRRILGVIIPTIETIIEGSSQNVLLIGTRRTVDSHKYELELKKRNAPVTLVGCATPELVPLIESHNMHAAEQTLETYVKPRVGEIDTLVLGCTHYGALKTWVRQRHPELTVIAQEEVIPDKLATYLHVHTDLEHTLSQSGACTYVITSDASD